MPELDQDHDLSPDNEDDTDTAQQFPVDFSRIGKLTTDPLVLRSLVAITAALLLLILPRANDFVVTVLGVALIAMALSAMVGIRQVRSSMWSSRFTIAFELAAGIALIAFRSDDAATIGRIVALLIGAIGFQALIRTSKRDPGLSRNWQWVQSLAVVALAALVVLFPTTVVWWTIEVYLIAWALVGFISASVRLSPALTDRLNKRLAENPEEFRSRATIEVWLAARPRSRSRRENLYRTVFFEHAEAHQRLIRFWVLMAFASTIGAMGVIADSTAVVIGAMLIAPLMTPLMAMSIALTLGWQHRLRNASLTALSGIAIAISTGLLLGLTFAEVINVETNSQILSRTSPTTVDLVIALAAGAAGAYGLGRPDVADSLPGVAIAISLVPPLCVVGVCISQTEFALGLGALLLFSTNMLAILVMGGLTFTLIGMTPIQQMKTNAEMRRTWLAGIALFGAIVLGGLLLNDRSVATDAIARYNLDSTVTEWLEPYENYRVVDTSITKNKVTAVVAGPADGELPQAGVLAELLQEGTDAELEVTVRITDEDVSTITTTSPSGSDGEN